MIVSFPPSPEAKNQTPGHFEAPDGSFGFDYPTDWILTSENNVIKISSDSSDPRRNRGEIQITYQKLTDEEISNFESNVEQSLDNLDKREGVMSSPGISKSSSTFPEGTENTVMFSYKYYHFQEKEGVINEFVSYFRFDDLGFQLVRRSYDDIRFEVEEVFKQIYNTWKFGGQTAATPNPTAEAIPTSTDETGPSESAQATESGIEDVISSLGYKFTRPKDWAAVDNSETYFLYSPGRDLAKPGADTSPDALIGLANITGNAEKTVRDLQNAGLVEDAPVPSTNKYGIEFTVLSYSFNNSGGKKFADLAIADYNGKTYTITVYSPYNDADKRAKNEKIFELFVNSFEFTK